MSKPFRARARTMAAPIPLLPPVINAISFRAITDYLTSVWPLPVKKKGFHAFHLIRDPARRRDFRQRRLLDPDPLPQGGEVGEGEEDKGHGRAHPERGQTELQTDEQGGGVAGGP